VFIGVPNSVRRQIKAKVNPWRLDAARDPELAQTVRPPVDHRQFADRIDESWKDLLVIGGLAPTCRTLKS
jgi:hypothetical protein